MTQDTPTWFEHQPNHNHQLVLYDTPEEQFNSAVPFIQDGLDNDERVLYLFHDNTEEEVVTALQKRGVDVDAARSSGQLSFEDAADVYLTGRDFKSDEMIGCAKNRIAEAVDAGYGRLRIVGEITWVAEHDIDLSELRAYEKKVDALFPTDTFMGQCHYRRSLYSPDFLCSLLQTHPRVAFTGDQQLNCFYSLPEEYENGISPESIDRKLKTISKQHQVSTLLDERERCLSLLGQMTDQLREAGPDEIGRIAGDLVAELVDPVIVSFCRYDSVNGRLDMQVLTDTLPISSSELIDDLYERSWDAFVENDLQEFSLDTDPGTEGLILPTGQHGVFLVATLQTNEITETDRYFLRAVTGHTKAVLDHMAYKKQLEDKHEELYEQRDCLERINRLNTVIREVNQSLIEATTEDEVVQTVCELLVRNTRVEFAWFGEYEPAAEALNPAQVAGNDQDYLEAVALDNDWYETEPSGRAARSRDVVTAQNIYDGPPLDHWQEQALKRGFQSMVSLPVAYDNSLYGVLSLYSDIPATFDAELVTVLDELSDCVAYALNSIDRKQALVAEEIIELEIRVTDTELPIVEFVDKYGSRVTINDVVSADNSGFSIFTTFHDVTADEIREFAVESPKVDDIDLLSEGDQVHTAECKITDQCVMAKLLNHNVVPDSVCAEDGEAYLVVHLRQEQSVRRFLEMFQSLYPSASMIARRDRKQPLRHTARIESQLEQELTERQYEILKMAYRSGYFERPRGRSAEELAEELDVSHPTVGRHLREAERRVFSLIFENP